MGKDRWVRMGLRGIGGSTAITVDVRRREVRQRPDAKKEGEGGPQSAPRLPQRSMRRSSG